MNTNPAASQGWIKAADLKSGRTYFANTVTRKTQWDAPAGWMEEECPPLLPPEDNSDGEGELPSNWEVMHDPTTGKPFYVDHERKITQWTRPQAEKKQARMISHAPANTSTSSAAMARILQASSGINVSQPRSYFQEASYFQPSHSGTAGEVDLSDSMPALDFTVKKVADKFRLVCPHCDALFTLSKRRHHCRLCGDVFCDACSSHRVSLPLEGVEFEKPVRICDFCNKDVEQGNFFSMRRYLTPLTLFDPENEDEDEENGVATPRNVNAALAAVTQDLDQVVQNAEGFEEKVTIPSNILIPNIIKHLSSRHDTWERAIRALASLLSLGSIVGKSGYAHAVYLYGKRRTLDQILGILERSGSDRRTLFVQEKAAQVVFYLTEAQVMSSVSRKYVELSSASDEELGDVDSLDIQRCLQSVVDHSSNSKNPNLQRWSTATVRNLVIEDQRRTCLAINDIASKVASGEPASTPEYESFLDHLVSTGGIMILCSLIGADDSDTRAHATGALGAILAATRAIDSAMSALSEITGGAAGKTQKKDGDIVRAITAGSGFGSSVSQLLLSADNSVAGMGCEFVASLVLPILSDPEGSVTLPSKYDCRSDPEGLGACREAALEIVGGGCFPALLSLVRENGRLTRPLLLRCAAMETFAAAATAVGEIGRAWANGKYEEGMDSNHAPASLTRAVAAFSEEQGIDVALEVLTSSSVQSLGSQRDTPATRIREAAGIVLGAMTSCSAEAIMTLHSRQVLSNLITATNDSTMTAPSTLRGDNSPRCLGMLEAASAILMFAWQHPAGASSELLDRLIEALDVGAVTYLFRSLTFKMDWEARDKSAGGMKTRAAACRLVCCLFGIALTDETSIGMRRLMDSSDVDQASRRVLKGPRNIMEAVLTTLQTSLTHAHRLLAGGVTRGVHYHAALLDLVEASLLATGSMCGSSIAPGGTDGTMISGDQFLAIRADEFESRRREVCKVACDVVIRGDRAGPALLPTMLIGGFGEGSVGASLRLALAIAQNGSTDQHSKLASSGILVPVSDLLKAALNSGDLYRFSAALALVRFCGPHVASGTSGGIQSVRDAIKVAMNVLTLPIDPGASAEQTQVQKALKAECVRAIESLSTNASLWSAISSDALPAIINYLDNSIMDPSATSFSHSDTMAAALRAVLEIVQVPSHAVFAAECGLIDSLGKVIESCHNRVTRHDEPGEGVEILAFRILRILVSKGESRRYCKLVTGRTFGLVCAAIGKGATVSSNSDHTGYSDLAVIGIEIIYCAIADIQGLGDTADVLHSTEAKFLVESMAGEPSFIRALCATLLKDKTGMKVRKHRIDDNEENLSIPSVYGPSLKADEGPCADFQNFYDAAASLLFTASVYACAIDSNKSDSFWECVLAQDLYSTKDEIDCRRASLVLSALFLSLISEGYFGILPQDKGRRRDDEQLLYPLLRYRILEALRDLLHDELNGRGKNKIDEYMLEVLVAFEVPRICLSLWSDPALLELSYELLSVLVEEEPEEIMQTFVENKESIMSLFDNLEAVSLQVSNASSVRRFLASTLENLARSGALAEAVERFDVKSSAIDALAAACLAEEESSAEEEEELTSNRLSSVLMQCLVDLCTAHENGRISLELKSGEAVSIAEKLGKKICHMVISRFLERAKLQQYEIDDGENVMDAPDVAMLCAIAQHENALKALRSIGGFHALAQVAGEGELSAIEALAKGCKEDPTLLLEADTHLSILGLFSGKMRESFGVSRRTEVECAAFNILAQLCAGSAKGGKAVTSAAGFGECFDRALDLVARTAEPDVVTVDEAEPAEPTVELAKPGNNEISAGHRGSRETVLVEAAFSFLSSTIQSKIIQDSLVRNAAFVGACFQCARQRAAPTLRAAAVRIIARLARRTTPQSALTPEHAGDLLREALIEEDSPPEGCGHDSNRTQVISADGLYFVFDKLPAKMKQTVIQDVSKIYTSVLKGRCLSKSTTTAADRVTTGELAYCLTRMLLLATGNEIAETTFWTAVVAPLVGTVQWRFDTKTVLADDELLYWDASTTHALQILSSWLEQGKPYLPEGTGSTQQSRHLQENVWMVGRPGRAPRKSMDFRTALELAAKDGESTARLAAERVLIWLSENF